MDIIIRYLDERNNEFMRHYDIAKMLEARVDIASTDGEINIEVRHINTMKSGLLIHLYNIVEAVSTQTLEHVGEILASENPRLWTEKSLKEWVRSEFRNSEARLGDKALKNLTKLSGQLVSGEKVSPFTVKGVPGSWDDNAIKKIASRLGCELILSTDIKKMVDEKVYINRTTAMMYLASRRNDIAHGNITFEDGAKDLTLAEVKKLSERVLPFLEAVTLSYKKFLDEKMYLKSKEAAA